MKAQKPTTRISTHTNDDIEIRGKSLIRDLIGKRSFTEMLFFHVTERFPSPGETRVVDAILVTLMEHGLTPSAIAARMVYGSSPEALQSGIAAGLLAVASRFVGTMEECAGLLAQIVAAPEAARSGVAQRLAEQMCAARTPVPGFGHHLHRPDDPRTPVLLKLAAEEGVAGAHVAALGTLAHSVDAALGRHITVNATGAVAALLGDLGVPTALMRGFAVVSRAGGLLGHIAEERRTPSMRYIWETVEDAVPYSRPD
jgi:citrate synthase